MTPEAPAPFPIPEITYDESLPPRLMDLEFHPEALANLISQLGRDRNQKCNRIIIQGGLVLFDPEPDPRGIHSITVPLENDAGIRDAIYYAFLKLTIEKFGVGGGYYSPQRRAVTICPDTWVVSSILFPSIRTGNRPSKSQSPIEQPSAPSLIKKIHDWGALTIVEELEHSFQKGIQHTQSLIQIIPLPLLGRYFDKGARRKKRDQHLHQLAQEAITLKPMITDEQLLEYTLFAHNLPGNQGFFWTEG